MPKNEGPPSILLAVKEDALQRIIRDFLRTYGVAKTGAYPTAKEAVDQLRVCPGKWDILLVDAAFPDTFEKIIEIRGELDSSIQIMVILSDPTREKIVEAVQAGVNDFLATPFSQGIFERKLAAMTKNLKALRAPSPFSVPMS